MKLPLLLLCAAMAAAMAAAQTGAPTVTMLKDRFLGATEEPDRAKALDELAKTAPTTAQDVSALFDLFSRFPNPLLRKDVMASLALISSDNPQLEPLFVNYLQQPEPETQLFGINGAFRLRSRAGLPLVRKIAERKFDAADANALTVLSQRNAWWTQYEALSALAQWEGEKALPLLRAKAEESPAVARLLGQFFWKQTFPDLEKWAVSSDERARARAAEASGAPIEPGEARAVRERVLALVRDPKTDDVARHHLALKAGASATDSEVEELIAEHDKAPDDRSRLMWAAAVFASHSPKAVPLLTRYAKQSPDEFMRKGARAQLVEMLGEEPVEKLLGETTPSEKNIKK